MKKYEVKFELGSKGILSILNSLDNTIHTQTIMANSGYEAEKRVEAMYADKKVKIRSCRYIG